MVRRSCQQHVDIQYTRLLARSHLALPVIFLPKKGAFFDEAGDGLEGEEDHRDQASRALFQDAGAQKMG